jgi:ABC-type multidrug transport system fused ATPase/permease subunit
MNTPAVQSPQEALQFEWFEAQRRFANENAERMIEFSRFTTDLFQRTLKNAANTYRLVTWMSVAMFVVGIGLFVAAVVYAVAADEAKGYAALFGGLGTTTFVAIFILKPIEGAQTALSNLIQAEVGFMNFFEQIRMWTSYPYEGQPPQLSHEKLGVASERLQQRAGETMSLLEQYLEPEERKS